MSFLKSIGPAIARVPPWEALRAAAGTFLGLAFIDSFLSPALDLETGLFLVAPLGATAVLVFAAPNSPLAQPWSAIVGNSLAAAVAIGICQIDLDPMLRISLVVSLSLLATMLARAVHPPAGAIALTVALTPEIASEIGFRFVLTPVALGTVTLVCLAALYARLTGRRYPFRQFGEPDKSAAGERSAADRLGLSKAELTAILGRYRQSLNLGVEDLARLIGAAEVQAATRAPEAATAEPIMSRDLVTVGPETSIDEVIEIFRKHRFTSLPVVGPGGKYLGVIYQFHLIDAVNQALAHQPHALGRWVRHWRGPKMTAREIMATTIPKARPDTPVAHLVQLMAERDLDAIPVLEGEVITGIVTRTDLVAALARLAARREMAV